MGDLAMRTDATLRLVGPAAAGEPRRVYRRL